MTVTRNNAKKLCDDSVLLASYRAGSRRTRPSWCCLLDVWPEGSIEQCGEGVPGRGHADRHGEGDQRENQRCGPHGGPVDAADRDKFVDDENENQDAEAGDGSSGRRKSDSIPGKAAEGGGDQTLGSDQDEALVGVGTAPGAPGSVNDDGEADDADQWDGSDRDLAFAGTYGVLRYSPGLAPTTRLNALLNAASDS
jgi:hypothetical protein